MVEDQNSEEPEVTPQDQEPETLSASLETQQETEETQGQEDSQDRNWKALRQKADRVEELDTKLKRLEEEQRQKDEFIKMVLAAQQNASPSAPLTKEEIDEFANMDRSDYLNLEQLDTYFEKRFEKKFKKRFEAEQQAIEKSRYLERLQSKYKDFDRVVNSDTLNLLEKQEPELAKSIADIQDPYQKWFQAYHFLKGNVSQGDADEKRNAKEVERNLEKSKKAVQSPQAFEKRPMAKAFDIAAMSQDEKNNLYNEMMGYASMSSGF